MADRRRLPGRRRPLRRCQDWQVPAVPECEVVALAEATGLSRLTSRVLAARGVRDAVQAAALTSTSLKDLPAPVLLSDMDRAVERIMRAVRQREPALIFGDYDVDGITAAAVLSGMLRMLGVRPEFYIPHRTTEGYGLNPEAVKSIAASGVRLVITVDCGIKSVAEAQMLADAGIDLVITDHHHPGVTLPPAAAVVNPHLSPQYPTREIAGVTVAFYLAWALAEAAAGGRMSERFRRFIMASLPLVALGTLADVVPLVSENRLLAGAGLRMMERTEHVGLRALIEAARLAGRPLSAHSVVFGLAPRINAAGRMLHAREALELFLTASRTEAAAIAGRLDDANRKRQRVEEGILRQVLADMPADVPAALVAAGDDWHAGVIGVVAGKLSDMFYRPAVLVAFDGEDGRGSARSVDNFNLYEALSECAGYFEAFGGHARAAGFSIRRCAYAEFREAFIAVVERMVGERGLAPTLRTDGLAPPAELTLEAVGELSLLGPFGEGNAEPLLMLEGARLLAPARVIGSGKHLSFHVAAGDQKFRVVGFNMVPAIGELEAAAALDLAVTPRVDDFAGRRSVSLFLQDFRSA